MLPYQSMPFGMVHYPIFSLLPERRPALCRCATPRLRCRVSVIPSLEFILQLQFFSQYIWNGKCEPRVSYCPNAPNTLVVSSPSTPCRCESQGYAPPAGSGQQACRTLPSPHLFTNKQPLLQKTTPMGLDIAKPMPMAQEVFARSSATLGKHPVSRYLLTSSTHVIHVPFISSYTARGTQCFKDVLLSTDCKPTETIGIGIKGQGCICVPKNSASATAQPCPQMVSSLFYLSVQRLVLIYI